MISPDCFPHSPFRERGGDGAQSLTYNMKTKQTETGKGECALRINWSTYVSLLKADLEEQSAIVSGFLAKAGNLSADELSQCTNATGRVANLRNLLQLIGEYNHE